MLIFNSHKNSYDFVFTETHRMKEALKKKQLQKTVT